MWNQKCVIWVLFGKNFKYTIVMFEMSRLEFVYLQNLSKKLKLPNSVILGLNLKATLSNLKSAPLDSF